MYIPSFSTRAITSVLIVGLLGPILVYYGQQISRARQMSLLTEYICRVAEPRLQTGAIRDVQDYLNSTAASLNASIRPSIVLREGDSVYRSGADNRQRSSQIRFVCAVAGREDIQVEFIFNGSDLSRREIIISYLIGIGIAALSVLVFSNVIQLAQKVAASSFESVLIERLNLESLGLRLSRRRKGFSSFLSIRPALLGEINKQINELTSALDQKQNEIAELQSRTAFTSLAKQVSHDIRSPLSALNMALSNCDGISAERQSVAVSAIRRINDIANSLLKSSKSITQKSSVNVSDLFPLDLVEAVESLVQEKRVEYSTKPVINIESDIPPNTRIESPIDRAELLRALSNLINNSVEAVRDNGNITVSLRASKRMASVSVRDLGCGISPDLIDKIGTEGASFGKNSSRSGNGLGLFHARRLAERHGGRFTVQSQIGNGTIITLDLPRTE